MNIFPTFKTERVTEIKGAENRQKRKEIKERD